LLHETTASITTAILGAASTTERENILKWARGLDAKDDDVDGNVTEARLIMGDPLHGEAALIQYGGTEEAPDVTAFVPTNDGYLHAVSTLTNTDGSAGGTEMFAFVPNELLGNLKAHYDANGNATKVYGLDGSVTAWVNDQDKDGIIESGDHAYIYFGMRRGGNNYYALDVTDRNNPKILWIIKGGSGNFTELGQTWSQPKLRKVKYNNVEKQVLIFAGGYDTGQDANATRADDDIGRAVYIVDAKTGERLWWASKSDSDLNLPQMKYSIPSTVATADTDGDNYVDALYVGDMGGQLFRFDIAKGGAGTSLPGLITGGRIGEFSQDGSEPDNRRIYYPPSVANVKMSDGAFHRVVTLGTGYREHPLVTSNADRIYILMDNNSPGNYSLTEESDLFDGSNSLATTDTEKQVCTTSGLYAKLQGMGEKSLANTVIFGSKVYASTYIPYDSTNVASCAPSEGSGRLYKISIAACGVTANDIIDLTSPGIPSELRIITPEDQTNNQGGKQVGCVGTECESIDENILPKLYWSDR
ncbi:MAG: type pilus assembly protein PilY1, partial [Pseudomonadota bacterium]|nr:type pilus assembly protein PilY1 [Pseudomonadota bacterium]